MDKYFRVRKLKRPVLFGTEKFRKIGSFAAPRIRFAEECAKKIAFRTLPITARGKIFTVSLKICLVSYRPAVMDKRKTIRVRLNTIRFDLVLFARVPGT